MRLNILCFKSNGYKGKLELQELMFPKGILYNKEKGDFRTPEINEVAFAMAEIARGVEGKDLSSLINGFQSLRELMNSTRSHFRL